jgi:hypothetical protein
MATRGRIAIELKDGSLLSIYSHWDNYPEHNGRILRTHYNTREKVTSLIDGGDVSSLWTDKDWNGNEWSDCKYQALTYAMRGDDCPPRLDADLCEYLLPDNSEEYAYVFRNGEWMCYNMHQFDNSKLPEVVEIPNGALMV